jgi:hypothetical protein
MQVQSELQPCAGSSKCVSQGYQSMVALSSRAMQHVTAQTFVLSTWLLLLSSPYVLSQYLYCRKLTHAIRLRERISRKTSVHRRSGPRYGIYGIRDKAVCIAGLQPHRHFRDNVELDNPNPTDENLSPLSQIPVFPYWHPDQCGADPQADRPPLMYRPKSLHLL